MAKSKRGFASMDPAVQRAIASKGGMSVAPEKRSFSQNRELASEAGRKGGSQSKSNQGFPVKIPGQVKARPVVAETEGG